jgi:hypothetical protein
MSLPGASAGTGSDIAGREVNLKVLTNAIAYQFEQVFGYAQAAQHPVAYEESLRHQEFQA